MKVTNTSFVGDGALRSAVPLASDLSDGGGLYILNSLSISIDSCSFQRLKALNGGAILITESANSVYA